MPHSSQSRWDLLKAAWQIQRLVVTTLCLPKSKERVKHASHWDSSSNALGSPVSGTRYELFT
ncbi:hypothetical protein E2C01_019272 [Portunus trituberculatus]|uniref:Uncharacterized protein n=1 Tax=Portunus trituberculatus TaxID=210409 RepID=A0A5B7DX53_PORTR|nr:hypothetical protein [Portunus trituberculatus]